MASLVAFGGKVSDPNIRQHCDSLYDALGRVGKHHFIEWFVGKQVNDRWLHTVDGASNVATMINGIDEGIEMKCTTSFDFAELSLGTRNYVDDASVLIGIFRRVTGDLISRIGMTGSDGSFVSHQSYVGLQVPTKEFWFLSTHDGTSGTNVDSTVNADANTDFILAKMELMTSDALCSINGNLEVTKTTNLSTFGTGNPFIFNGMITNQHTTQTHCRYIEAYNT